MSQCRCGNPEDCGQTNESSDSKQNAEQPFYELPVLSMVIGPRNPLVSIRNQAISASMLTYQQPRP